jgi:hypothetical protein
VAEALHAAADRRGAPDDADHVGNEWIEDTAIEPVVLAPATASDRSGSGSAYTQGFPYLGYGTRYLEILREQTGR